MNALCSSVFPSLDYHRLQASMWYRVPYNEVTDEQIDRVKSALRYQSPNPSPKILALWSSGGSTRYCDYLMTDGTIQTLYVPHITMQDWAPANLQRSYHLAQKAS